MDVYLNVTDLSHFEKSRMLDEMHGWFRKVKDAGPITYYNAVIEESGNKIIPEIELQLIEPGWLVLQPGLHDQYETCVGTVYNQKNQKLGTYRLARIVDRSIKIIDPVANPIIY